MSNSEAIFHVHYAINFTILTNDDKLPRLPVPQGWWVWIVSVHGPACVTVPLGEEQKPKEKQIDPVTICFFGTRFIDLCIFIRISWESDLAFIDTRVLLPTC